MSHRRTCRFILMFAMVAAGCARHDVLRAPLRDPLQEQISFDPPAAMAAARTARAAPDAPVREPLFARSLPARAVRVFPAGGSVLRYCAERDGVIYVCHDAGRAVAYAGTMRAGDQLEVDPGQHAVRLNQRPVPSGVLPDSARYELYFDPLAGSTSR